MSASHNAHSTSSSQKVYPRDAMVILCLLQEMGVTAHEPRVINQLLEFIYRYVTFICEEARAYSTYAKKKMIDVQDIKLAIKMMADKSYSTVPPREMLLDVAKQKNMTPLPVLKTCSGLRLPPDRFCLTQPNYQLQFYKRAIASSSSQPAQNTRLPGSPSVFKTPTHAPPRSLTSSATNSGTPSTPLTASTQPTFRVVTASSLTSSTSSSPSIIHTSSGTPISAPTIRVVTPGTQHQSVISGTKRKLSEDNDDGSFGNF